MRMVLFIVEETKPVVSIAQNFILKIRHPSLTDEKWQGGTFIRVQKGRTTRICNVSFARKGSPKKKELLIIIYAVQFSLLFFLFPRSLYRFSPLVHSIFFLLLIYRSHLHLVLSRPACRASHCCHTRLSPHGWHSCTAHLWRWQHTGVTPLLRFLWSQYKSPKRWGVEKSTFVHDAPYKVQFFTVLCLYTLESILYNYNQIWMLSYRSKCCFVITNFVKNKCCPRKHIAICGNWTVPRLLRK